MYLECLSRPFTLRFDRRFLPGRKGLTSLQSVSPVFLPTDHCPPTCPDPVGITAHYCFKSFSCNTYESPRKTYVQAKHFRCNTHKKQGATHRPSDVWAFRLTNLFPFKHLRTHSRDRRSASLFFQSLAHSFRCDGGVCPGCPRNLPARRRANVRPILSPYLITSSISPSVPLQPNALGATIGKVARILHDPGKQLRSPRCLRLRERTSGTVQHRSRSQTPVRSELQVVPRSSVLYLDRSAGWLASRIRQGCW